MTGSAARFGGSPGPVFALDKGERVEQMKLFKTYKEQVELRVKGQIVCFLSGFFVVVEL